MRRSNRLVLLVGIFLAIVAFGLFPNLIFSITDGAATHLTRAFG